MFITLGAAQFFKDFIIRLLVIYRTAASLMIFTIRTRSDRKSSSVITATDKNSNRDANARLPKTDKSTSDSTLRPREECSDNYYNCMEIIPEPRNRRRCIAMS